MRRQIFYGFESINEKVNKKNQKSMIWALPLIYLPIFLIYFFINNAIFHNENINQIDGLNLTYISFIIYFVGVILYLIYVFSYIIKQASNFRSKVFRYVLMFMKYILFLPIFLLVCSNNAILIFSVSIIYILLFFVTPLLKYVNKYSLEFYIKANQGIHKKDYTMPIFMIVVIVVSILDMIINHRDNILVQLYDTPIYISYFFYIYACIFIVPKYTHRLWINIFYSKFILQEINDYPKTDNDEFDDTPIKEVIAKKNEVQIIYIDGTSTIYDQTFIGKRFYNQNNEQMSIGFNGIIDVKNDGGIVHAIKFNNIARKVVIYNSKFSNLIVKIKANEENFSYINNQKIVDLILNILSFIILFFACNWPPLFCYAFPFHYFILREIEYYKLWQKIVIKVLFILLYAAVFMFIVY